MKNHDFTPKNIFFPVAEGGAKIVGVFRVKNHDFTPKNIFFPVAEGGAKIVGVFRVKNHDFTPKNHIFSNFSGGGGGCEKSRFDPKNRRVRPPPPPGSAPVGVLLLIQHLLQFAINGD